MGNRYEIVHQSDDTLKGNVELFPNKKPGRVSRLIQRLIQRHTTDIYRVTGPADEIDKSIPKTETIILGGAATSCCVEMRRKAYEEAGYKVVVDPRVTYDLSDFKD